MIGECNVATFNEVLHIFGYDDERAEEMMYLNWLHQLQMSLVSTQSHCCARHVYLQVLLRTTKGLVWIEPIYDDKKVYC